jgi:hypothetical protein
MELNYGNEPATFFAVEQKKQSLLGLSYIL